MRTIQATGIASDPPTITVSGGQGNRTGNPEVHLIFREPGDEVTRSVMGWFNKAELLAAIEAAGEE